MIFYEYYITENKLFRDNLGLHLAFIRQNKIFLVVILDTFSVKLYIYMTKLGDATENIKVWDMGHGT